MEYMMVNGYQIPALTLNELPMPEIGSTAACAGASCERTRRWCSTRCCWGTLYPHLAGDG